MIPTRLTARHLLGLCTCLLLGACGGDPDPDPQPDPYVQQFNPYLPLAVGASLSYYDANFGNLDSMHILNEELTQAKGVDIYEVTFDGADNTFSFFFSSAANNIKLYGIDGPINVTAGAINYSLDKLRFNTPLVLQSDFNNQNSGTTNASATISSGSSSSDINNVSISYTTINLDTSYSGSYGTLPVRGALLSAQINASVNVLGQTLNIDETLSNSLLFAKGIGIVRHTGSYVSAENTHNSEVTALNNLPRSVWFHYNNGNPSLASGSSSSFQINGQGNISSSQYDLVNMSDINALGWITVQESGGRYSVSMPGGGNLPSTSTSVEVVFEHNTTGRRLSANVTLLAP
jgi:hypothetical protein